jgi:hypothetical protein
MTAPAPVASPSLATLNAAAVAVGLTVLSSASWPETEADGEPPALAGWVLRGRDRSLEPGTVTAIVIVTTLGDVTCATRVAATVDAGRRVPPLLFFQSVPNSVAGYVAARWHLTGPVVCVTGTTAGVEVAALLIEDADADAALVVWVDVALSHGDRDCAAAILVTGPASRETTGNRRT